LNGCFTADFNNYVVAYNISSSSDRGVAMRFRASGSDASGSDYVWQLLQAESTTVEGSRATSQSSGRIYYTDVIEESANNIAVYGPYLAQPTAYRSVVTGFRDGAGLYNFAGTHSLSTSYDGLTFITISPVAGVTGKLAVYGVRS
jgi:hypothetical protein